MAASDEIEIVAEQVSDLVRRLDSVESRVAEIDKVIARLEGAAVTTARSLEEISTHWHAVYEAMRRVEEPDVVQLRAERDRSRRSKGKA
jgi:uncharacterized coiled-coil protein SlyX